MMKTKKRCAVPYVRLMWFSYGKNRKKEKIFLWIHLSIMCQFVLPHNNHNILYSTVISAFHLCMSAVHSANILYAPHNFPFQSQKTLFFLSDFLLILPLWFLGVNFPCLFLFTSWPNLDSRLPNYPSTESELRVLWSWKSETYV